MLRTKSRLWDDLGVLLEVGLDLFQGPAPVGDAVLDLLIELRVRLVVALGLKNRVPPKVEGAPRWHNLALCAPHKHHGFHSRTLCISKDALPETASDTNQPLRCLAPQGAVADCLHLNYGSNSSDAAAACPDKRHCFLF